MITWAITPPRLIPKIPIFSEYLFRKGMIVRTSKTD